MDQSKMERLLRLMKLMSGNVNYSVEQLSQKLDMSERTIYRYIEEEPSGKEDRQDSGAGSGG